MTALLKKQQEITINQDIRNHPAWLGKISGLKAEKMLRDWKKPYLYIIRAGEYEDEYQTDYYVSFVLPDFSVRHQPVVITTTSTCWFYENFGPGGPYVNETVDDVLHLIMHCNKHECTPLITG